MVNIDIHVHTTASSCSNFFPEDLVRTASDMKVPVVVTTNHKDSVGDAAFLKENFDQKGILYFPGLELTNEWGDFLVFGENLDEFQGNLPEFPRHLLPDDNIAVIWAHPYRFYAYWEIEKIKHAVAPYIDAVEGINGNCMRSKPMLNDMALELAKQLQKPATGGSDSHFFHSYFKAYTKFDTEISCYADFVRAIKEGRVTWGMAEKW
ncbi:MAG: PHP domain-containing protein [Firmicutes bacterium]|nr:PHP domain-containing protein [Bacillota bacterium]